MTTVNITSSFKSLGDAVPRRETLDILSLRILESDMPNGMQSSATDVVREALKWRNSPKQWSELPLEECKDVVVRIRKEFDRMYQPRWHVLLKEAAEPHPWRKGADTPINDGLYTSYDAGTYISFDLGGSRTLDVYKSGRGSSHLLSAAIGVEHDSDTPAISDLTRINDPLWKRAIHKKPGKSTAEMSPKMQKKVLKLWKASQWDVQKLGKALEQKYGGRWHVVYYGGTWQAGVPQGNVICSAWHDPGYCMHCYFRWKFIPMPAGVRDNIPLLVWRS